MTKKIAFRHLSDFLQHLAASGRHHFTFKEAKEALGSSENAVRGALRRQVKRRKVANPHRGFFIIVPPEYSGISCLPPLQFIDQLAAYRKMPYYVGLLSAAEYHGAASQRPQIFQVIARKTYRSIECGRVKIDFIARKRMEVVPVTTVTTPRGFVRVSTPEATILDCAGYPGRCGGISAVAGIVAELIEKIDASKLVIIAQICPNAWVQRIGYLLELAGAEILKAAVARYITDVVKTPVILDPALPHSPAVYSATWKLLLNTEVTIER